MLITVDAPSLSDSMSPLFWFFGTTRNSSEDSWTTPPSAGICLGEFLSFFPTLIINFHTQCNREIKVNRKIEQA